MSIVKKIKSKVRSFLYWTNSVTSFKRFLKINGAIVSPAGGLQKPVKIAIIVHPWLMTPTPFFSIATGVFLIKRGNQVDFIVDDLFFGKSVFLYKIQLGSIKYVLKFLPESATVIFISSLKPEDDDIIVSDEYLRGLASQNSVHYMKGELKQEGRKAYQESVYKQLFTARPYICRFMSSAKYDSIHLSGGIYSTTGLYLAYSKHYGIRANTFDAGFGVLVSSTNGIAAQLSDIPYSVELLEQEISQENRQFIKEFSLNQIEQRKAGTDVFGFLDSGINPELIPDKVGVLILLNSVWDSAALGIHNIYNGYVEWLDATIDHVLKNTSGKITVRQHPGEKLDYQEPSDDLKSHLIEKFGVNKRILFVDCHSKINTYQLIEASDIVVCFSSTSGIESAILGKAVIVASNCYYSDQGFVFKPDTITDYYSLISRGLSGGLKVKEDQINRAILFYYLGQCCNWIFTEFTPMPGDFKKWVNTKYDLTEVPEVKMYLKSIEDYLPISLLVSRNRIDEIDYHDKTY